MCTATHPAVFQAPAHYRHLQFLKNSVLQNSSLGLQQKSVIKSGCKRGFSVVDKPSFTKLYSANYPSFPKQNNNNRLFRFRMGDMVRGYHSQGLWSGEETRWHINLKELMAGFIGLKLYVKGQPYLTHISLQMDNMTACHYIKYINQPRQNRFCQSLHARSQNVKVVSTKKYPHFGCLHPRSTQLHSRHSVPINKSQFRMETQSSNFSSDLCNLHYSRSRPFCNKSKQSSSEIHFMVPRSRCSGNQCFLNSLVQPVQLCCMHFPLTVKL